MIKAVAASLLAAFAFASPGSAQADESQFLQSLEGNWTGGGTVKVRTGSSPIKVNCKLSSDTSATSISLDGTCTGLVIFSRAIAADLKVTGASYSGSYVGAGTGTAGLIGKRSGNTINLGIRWAKEVNGDRAARMTIAKVGENGMRLTTTDIDPKTGKSVVTSQLNLTR